jgi:hypothetical protein
MKKVLDKEITIHFFEIEPSKFQEKGNGNRLAMQIEINNEKRLLWTNSVWLQETIKKIPKDAFPFKTIIKEENERFIFT